jgi:hypothetical protein
VRVRHVFMSTLSFNQELQLAVRPYTDSIFIWIIVLSQSCIFKFVTRSSVLKKCNNHPNIILLGSIEELDVIEAGRVIISV